MEIIGFHPNDLTKMKTILPSDDSDIFVFPNNLKRRARLVEIRGRQIYGQPFELKLLVCNISLKLYRQSTIIFFDLGPIQILRGYYLCLLQRNKKVC